MGFLKWLKKLFWKKEQKIPTIAELHKKDNYETVEYHPNPKVEEESQKLATKIEEIKAELRAMVKPSGEISERLKEERIKQQFLPQPQTHRKTFSKSYTPPAERHRESISKFMKGKASSGYLKTIKQSPKIKIEEDN